MAVVFEGFSIREYASKMRSIDVVKCWPFTGASSSSGDDDNGNRNSKISKQTMGSLLPPIKVTKFRWWSDELDLLKSTELQSSNSSGMEKNKLQEKQPRNQSDSLQVYLHVGEKSDERSDMLECPVCGAFAASTVTALNAHVDSCLAQASRQERRQMRMPVKPTKSRIPKKRPITEIFAAAPQIHMIDAADEYENGSLEKELNCKIGRPKKKKKVAIVKMLMNKRRKLKKKKKNNKQNGVMIANKENGSKLKLQTPVNSNRKANNTMCDRGSNAISILREKPSLKCMSKKKSKVVQASRLIIEHEKPSSPVRGILKNPAKSISGQNAVSCNSGATTLAGICGIQHSVRHVSFSGKDDIIGPHKKHVSFEENVCHVNSDSLELLEKDHENDDDREFPTREINASDEEDVSFSTENEIMVQDSKEKQLWPDMHHNVDIPKFLGPRILVQEKENHFSNRSLPPDQVVLDSGNFHVSNHGNQTAFHIPPYAVTPRHFTAVKENQNPFTSSQVGGGVSRTLNCSSQFVDYFGDRTQEVAISSKATPRASLCPLSSGFPLSKNANETSLFTSQFATRNVSGHALSHQLMFHPITSELRGRLCPFLDCEWKEVSLREKCQDEEIFGLPLNSLGELVQTNSNGKGGFNQLKKPSPAPGSSNSINNSLLPRSMDDRSIMKGKQFTESALSNYQSSLFPAQNHVKENATVHSSTRLGATDLQGQRKEGYFANSDRRCSRFDSLIDSDINLMNISYSGCGQYDQFRNRKEKDMSHATETAEKMFLNSATPTMRLMGKDVTICQSSDERRGFADAPKSIALQNSCVDKHFQQEWLLDPASGKRKEAPVRKFEIARSQAFPGNVLMKPFEYNFFQPSLNWQENPEFQTSSSITVAQDPNPSLHHFCHPHTSHAIFDNGADFHEPFVSRTEALRVTSRQPAASASHRNYQNINGYSVELENNQNLGPNAGKSSLNLPFLHPDHVEHVQPYWCRESSNSLIPFPWLQETQQVQATGSPSQLFPEVDGRHRPHTARTSFLINRLVPRFPIVPYDRNPSSAHSPFTPSVSVSVNPNQRNGIEFKDRMKSKIVGSQDPDICQKARKRPAVEEDNLVKPIKVSNLGIRDESRASTRLTRENLIDDIQCNMGSLEFEPERNEASVGGWIPNESQWTGFGLSAGIDSSKVDTNGTTRLSSIKLSPGVKHILKPNQNVGQDNSRLIHSTIPFASLTECGNMLETRKKSTKIYRF